MQINGRNIERKRSSVNNKFYQTKEWRKLVKLVWQRDLGLCQICLKEGKRHYLTKGTKDLKIQGTVDHIKPRPIDAPFNAEKWDHPSNLRLIGTNHHARKSGGERLQLRK